MKRVFFEDVERERERVERERERDRQRERGERERERECVREKERVCKLSNPSTSHSVGCDPFVKSQLASQD